MRLAAPIKGSPAARAPAAAALTVTSVVISSLPLPALRAVPTASVATAVVMCALGAAAMRLRSAPATRTVLVACVPVFGVLAFGSLLWEESLVLGIAVLWLAGRRVESLNPTMPWLRWGRMTGEIPWLILAVAVVSSVALVIWAKAVHPAYAGPYLESLHHRPLVLVSVGILGFALVNAVCEEAVYRGVFQSELTSTVGRAPAIIIQAVCFGLVHVSGYPSGGTGILLATVYGLLIGLLRYRSQGMLAPYVAHVLADTTIGILAVVVI